MMRTPPLLSLRRRLARWLLAGEALYEPVPGELEAALKASRFEANRRQAVTDFEAGAERVLDAIARFRSSTSALEWIRAASTRAKRSDP